MGAGMFLSTLKIGSKQLHSNLDKHSNNKPLRSKHSSNRLRHSKYSSRLEEASNKLPRSLPTRISSPLVSPGTLPVISTCRQDPSTSGLGRGSWINHRANMSLLSSR